MGLAPTTSTTMTLALGDAIAVALLERRGFTPTDFRVLHPGGKLGRSLIKVSDLMHVGERLPLIGETTSDDRRGAGDLREGLRLRRHRRRAMAA